MSSGSCDPINLVHLVLIVPIHFPFIGSPSKPFLNALGKSLMNIISDILPPYRNHFHLWSHGDLLSSQQGGAILSDSVWLCFANKIQQGQAEKWKTAVRTLTRYLQLDWKAKVLEGQPGEAICKGNSIFIAREQLQHMTVFEASLLLPEIRAFCETFGESE